MAERGPCMNDNLYKFARNPDSDIPNIDNQELQGRSLNGNNALHVAAQYGNTSFVAFVLARLGHEHRYHLLCQPNSNGEIPLHLAAEFGHRETVDALLRAHDDDAIVGGMFFGYHRKPCWNETDKKGDTPIHRALRNGYEDIAMLLLDRDIHLVSINNDIDESPAYLAAESSCNRFLNRILDAHHDGQCSISFSGPFGQTVFHSARRLTADIMERLTRMRTGNLLKSRDDKGKTVLHYAVEESKVSIVETLLTAESSLAYLQDNDGMTPLHVASANGLFSMVSTILELSPQSIEIRDNLGRTLLHVAKIGKGFLPKCLKNTTIKELINQVDNEGNTLLHTTLINSKYEAAFQLLRVCGCNWRMKNNQGYSPLDLCKSIDKIPHKSQVYIGLRDLEAGHEFRTRQKGRFSYLKWVNIRAIKSILIANSEEMDEEAAKAMLDKIGIAAALLLPVNFSAVFNVPGGYDTVTGKPILRNHRSYANFEASEFTAFISTVAVLVCCTFGHGKLVMKKTMAGLSIRFAQVAIVATVGAFMSATSMISDHHEISTAKNYIFISASMVLILDIFFLSELMVRSPLEHLQRSWRHPKLITSEK